MRWIPADLVLVFGAFAFIVLAIVCSVRGWI